MVSLGARSVWELALDEVARAANVLARPRNRGDAEVPEAMGDSEGKEWAGPVAGGGDNDISEGNDKVGEVMGTFKMVVVAAGDTFSGLSAEFGDSLYSNSGGISSAEGMGRPRAAATS